MHPEDKLNIIYEGALLPYKPPASPGIYSL